MSVSTVALPHLMTRMPLSTVHVVVVAGPDQGASASGARLTIGTAAGSDLLLSDHTVSRYHVELTALTEGIRVVDHGSTNGTRIGSARIHDAIIEPGTTLELGRSQLRVETAKQSLIELHPTDGLGDLRGRSAVMRRLMARVEQLASSDVAVLLVGESGTGKELIARGIHQSSPRQAKPMITVDCAALVPGLIASELFGHEQGAFTGADRRHIGAFERAAGGTVFLDEIGELPRELQTTLLGVLERRRIQRVGGHEEIAIDVRVVSATNRDLRREVNAGTFRLDLYYRLAVVSLDVPPLRERPEDVGVLLEHFLRDGGYDGPVERYFPPDTIRRLEEHRWPGNVRELRNLVEATLALGEVVAPAQLGDGPGRLRPPRPGVPVDLTLPYKQARAELLSEFERRYLKRAIDEADGNVSQAARTCRITRSHLTELLSKHGIR